MTDLFVLKSGSFSDDQIALFDVVMSRLLENIESAARAQFGSRIAKLPDAPRGVVRLLAPMPRSRSPGPCSPIANGSTSTRWSIPPKPKSQDHLLAISGRKMLVEAVTDVLVDRGNQRRGFGDRAKCRREILRIRGFHAGAARRATTATSLCASGPARIFRVKTWSSCSSMPPRRSRTSSWRPTRGAPN